MNARSRRTAVKPTFVLMIAALAALSGPLLAQNTYKARMYTGRAPVEPAVVNIRIEVENWTTPEEVRRFQELLVQSGTEPFLSAYSGSKNGVVRFMDSRGWNLPVHAAQITPTEKGKKIRLFLLRQTWNPGSQFASTGRYLFMAIELDLDEKGSGEGRFYEDASIKMDPDSGAIVMDAYASAPKMFPMVQEIVKKAKKNKTGK